MKLFMTCSKMLNRSIDISTSCFHPDYKETSVLSLSLFQVCLLRYFLSVRDVPFYSCPANIFYEQLNFIKFFFKYWHIHIIFSFSPVMEHINVLISWWIDFIILNQHCILWINLLWLWYITFYYNVGFVC